MEISKVKSGEYSVSGNHSVGTVKERKDTGYHACIVIENEFSLGRSILVQAHSDKSPEDAVRLALENEIDRAKESIEKAEAELVSFSEYKKAA